MRTDLTTNLPLENYADHDTFDFLPKADAIKDFLEFSSLDNNKMLALYGNWGSGKTSLMRYIESNINRGIYFPIFFEAWKYEKDDNLALSLFDAILNQTEDGWTDLSRVKRSAFNVLKGFVNASNIKISTPFEFLDFEFNGEKLHNFIKKNDEEKSQYKEVEEFKLNFQKLEDNVIEKNEAQRLIIFIDDLDRCEPENVLNLITALKLFFTYGNKSIFVTGLDKEAVTKAVKTKYQDIIKSEEYLEKVFDITFSIPKSLNLNKFLANYFIGTHVYYDNTETDNSKIVSEFLKAIHFTNPRHLKKIINKLEILTAFKTSNKISLDIKAYIPNILYKDKFKEGNIFETIFCLFFIILHEFNAIELDHLEHYNRKHSLLRNGIFNYKEQMGHQKDATIIEMDMDRVKYGDIQAEKLSEIISPNTENPYRFIAFILFFSPPDPHILGYMDDGDLNIETYSTYYQQNDILTLFTKYLIKNQKELIENDFSEYKLMDFFKMTKFLL